MIEVKTREARFAALEILVEIDEHGHHSLAIPGDFFPHRLRIEKVAVQHEFLSNFVVQDLRHLEAAQRRSELIGDPVPDHLDDEVRIGKIERSELIGATGINARRNIVDPGTIQPGGSRSNQPSAFGCAGEIGNGMDDRARRKHAAGPRGRL